MEGFATLDSVSGIGPVMAPSEGIPGSGDRFDNVSYPESTTPTCKCKDSTNPQIHCKCKTKKNKFLKTFIEFTNESKIVNAFKNTTMQDVKKILDDSYGGKFDWQTYLNVPIFKGISDQPHGMQEAYIVEYTTPRISPHTTNNFYNLFLSEIAPSWKEWPKRNKSIVGVTSRARSRIYGTTFYLIPLKGTKVAIAPSQDLWDSFKEMNPYFGNRLLDALNQFMDLVMNYNIYIKTGKIVNIKIDFNNIEDIKEYLNILSTKPLKFWKTGPKHILNPDYAINGTRFIDFLYKDSNPDTTIDWLQRLDELMSPIKNKFIMVEYNLQQITRNREVWMEGPVVLADASIVDRY